MLINRIKGLNSNNVSNTVLTNVNTLFECER